jgi:hypothetical protein
MYIVVTEVDYNTRIPCTVEPQRTGPSMPSVKGLQITWQDESTWPISTDSTGTYLRAPKYYGTCHDDADTTIAGVLQVLTETEYTAAKTAEHEARKPYPSWVGNLDTMTWDAPLAMPTDAVNNGGNVYYEWDEATVNWITF